MIDRNPMTTQVTMRNFIFSLGLALLILVTVDHVFAQSAADHDDCVVDEDCVVITEIKQFCRHLDPKSTETCPVINRKYAGEIGAVDCYRSVGCRAVTNIRCQQNRCVADSK